MSGGAGTRSRRRPLLSLLPRRLRRCPGDFAQLALPLPRLRCKSDKHKGIGGASGGTGQPLQRPCGPAHTGTRRGARGGMGPGGAGRAGSRGDRCPRRWRPLARRNPRSSSRGMGPRLSLCTKIPPSERHRRCAAGSRSPGRSSAAAGLRDQAPAPRAKRRESGVGLGLIWIQPLGSDSDPPGRQR